MTQIKPQLRFKEFDTNWSIYKFSDIFTFRSTNSFSRENLNYEKGIVRNIHYGDIHTRFNTLFDVNAEYVPFINLDISLNKILSDNYIKNGDLIIADASEDYEDIGKCIEVININNEKILSGLHTLLARPELMEMATGFIGYLMKTEKVKLQIKTIAQGTKVLSISTGRLSNINLFLPHNEEQVKITSFLIEVDARISFLKEKKSLLQDFKKGIIQQIFSQEIRFKDDNGNDFEDWEEKKIGDIFTVTRGKVLAMTMVNDSIDKLNLYPVYSSQTKNKGLSGYYNEYLFEDCITWTTDGAGAGDVNFRKGKFYCTNVCGVLLNNDGYSNGFIAEYLNSISRRYVSYIGNPKLMNNVMSEIIINIPTSIREQNKIADFLSMIDEKIDFVDLQIIETQEYKKGLLQQMFI